MRILVIDDDGPFRQMLKTWLLKQRHDVYDTDGGPDTFDRLKRTHYDVVTLDLLMPKANGLTVISDIRSLCPAAHIIIVSAQTSTRVAVECIKAGAEACLEKPVDFAALENELARLASIDETQPPGAFLPSGGHHSNSGKE